MSLDSGIFCSLADRLRTLSADLCLRAESLHGNDGGGTPQVAAPRRKPRTSLAVRRSRVVPCQNTKRSPCAVSALCIMSTTFRDAIARLDQSLELTPEHRAALEPCDDVHQHWAQVQAAIEIKSADHRASGDDVKPLAALTCDAGDMWLYLQLAKQIAALPRDDGAAVAGICAPVNRCFQLV